MTYGIYEDGAVIAKFVAPLQVTSNKPVFTSDALDLSRNAVASSAQRWEIQTNVEPLVRNAQDIFVHLIEHGHTTAFNIICPQNYGAVLARTSNSTPTAVGAKGSGTVTVTNNEGMIPRGTFIKFANHSKIYMTMRPRADNGQLSIYPPLRVAVNTTFTHRDDVIMPVKYDTDVIIGMVFTDGIVQDPGTLKLIEAI